MDSVLQAAAIASARAICHRGTWSFLIEQTSQHRHFRLPERIDDDRPVRRYGGRTKTTPAGMDPGQV
ncbi:hypothetical protein [Streptomyces sp. NPDC097610]|uniref:hypothetical protein n=1 Tax=Streptomyces sp. NPDC097610 TaxID=3157227 RepID=UPI00332B58DC